MQAAVFVLLATDGYMRPSEALNLHREDFHAVYKGKNLRGR